MLYVNHTSIKKKRGGRWPKCVGVWERRVGRVGEEGGDFQRGGHRRKAENLLMIFYQRQSNRELLIIGKESFWRV